MDVANETRTILEGEGLSSNAARVYLALLRLGSGSLSAVASRARLHPQSVKNGIRELQQEGLVTHVDYKLARTLFRPVPPFTIAKRLRQKQERFSRALPELQKLYREKTARFVRIHEGIDGFRQLYATFWESVGEKSVVDVSAHPGTRLLASLGDVYSQTEELRRTRGISKRVLVSPSVRKVLLRRPDIVQELNADYRVHQAAAGPMMQCIARDRVLLYLFDFSEPTTLLVEGQSFSAQVQRVFDCLWTEARSIAEGGHQ